MAISSSHFFCQILLVAIFICRCCSTFASDIINRPNPGPFKKIYAFGDSFTDTGNTGTGTGPNGFSHVSNPPYGSTYFHHPTNRYSDGRLVIDFVAERLSLPYLPPFRFLKGNATYGVNFAIGGSTAINHAFFVKNNLSLDLTPESIQTQLIWFNKFLERQGCKGLVPSSPECKETFDDALIWVGEIGVNDYAYAYPSTIANETIQKLAIGSLTLFLQALLKKGAKYLVVQGLPPAGCLPLGLTLASEDDRDNLGCAKSINNLTNVHNFKYQAVLQDLRKEFPGAIITYVDYWNAYHTVMENPGRYGFKEPLNVCCGTRDQPYNFDLFATCGTPSTSACPNPSQYINWDGVHLTEAMYNVLANMFVNGTFSHPPFESLLDEKRRQG